MKDSNLFVVGLISSPHPHASMHLQTLEVLPEVVDIHICGIEGEDIESMASLSSKVRSTTNVPATLLNRTDLDAIIVAVRNDLSAQILDSAIGARIPVLFEKPGASSASDLRRISLKARANSVTMGAFYQNRWAPSTRDVRRAVQGGALGKIIGVESRMVTSQVRYRDPSYWLFKKEFAGSGILSWLACHHIDMLCYILGEKISEVSAMVASSNPEMVSVEDTAMAVLKFESGILGTLNAGYHLVGSAAGYEQGSYDTFVGLRGVEGYLRIPNDSDYSFTVYSEAEGWASGGFRKMKYNEPGSLAYGGKAGEEFVLDFLHASRNGVPAPAPIEDAVHVMNVIEALLESADTGHSVKVPK